MSEMELSRRSTQGAALTDCALAVELAVMGIVSLLLPVDDLDDKSQAIRRSLLDHAHELREIAAELQADKR